MPQFRRRCAAALSVAVVAMIPAVSATADGAGPTLSADFPTIARGPGYAHLSGTGFDPSASYTVASDLGEPFTVPAASGQPSRQAASIDVTTTTDGGLSVPFTATTDIPAQHSSMVLTVTPAGGTAAVASWTERLSPPRLSMSVCPGRTFDVEGDGFPDGTYSATSSYASFESPFTSLYGSVSTRGTATSRVPTKFTVEVEQTEPIKASYTFTARRKAAALLDYSDFADGGLSVTGSCFDPGERLVITPLDRSTAAPARAVHASRYGNVSFAIPIRARTAPAKTAGVEVRGASSGYGRVVHAGYTVPGTTLQAGHQLIWPRQYQAEIDSPNGVYAFTENDCAPGVIRRPPGGRGEIGIWFAPGKQHFLADCTLTMQRDGNLVLRTGAGRMLWQTHTAGTGHHNRLVMRDNGYVTMYTQGGVRVWDDGNGLTASPASATLKAGASLLRGHTLAFNATRFTLQRNGDLSVYRAGKLRWRAHTDGRGGVRLTMQRDGNLVLLRSDGKTVWSTHTRGSDPRLVVRSNGDVALQTGRGAVRWHTATVGFA